MGEYQGAGRLCALIAASLVVASGGGLASGQDTAPRFTADRVFDLEWANEPVVSPDGDTVVYVRQSMDRQSDRVRGNLWMVDLASGAHRPVVTSPGSASAPRFSPDGSKLLFTQSTKSGASLRVKWLETGSSDTLAQFPHPPREAAWSPDGQHVAFTMFTLGEALSLAEPPKPPEGADWAEPVRVFDDVTFRFDGQGFLKEGADQVYTVPVDGGTPRQVTDGEADHTAPAWLDEDTLVVVGNPAPDRALDPIESELIAVELGDLSRQLLTERDGPDGAPVVSPDGRKIAYIGYDDERRSYQQPELYVMDADGSDPRRLTGAFDHPVASPAWRGDSDAILVQAEREGEIHLMAFGLDGSDETISRDLGGTSIGRPYAGAAFSVSAGERPVYAYTRGSPERPSELAVIAPGAQDRTLTDLNGDALDHLSLAGLESFTVEARDGRMIEAWVALPPGFEADGSFPLILEIHGGPYAMYGPFFAAEIQRYASEGYVTVYANPRGSTGYGEAFAQLIDKKYPGADHGDLLAVVEDLVARDYADPDRLFVTGGSGGGTLTAWIVGKTDRFAAAASIKPVINWMTMALAADIAPYVKRHWIGANPWSDWETYMKHSPITLAGNVETPTLVMVGEEDWRTPTWEAEQFYTALKMRGVETALIRVPGSPHYIAGRPSRLIAKTDNIMGWFARHDPAGE